MTNKLKEYSLTGFAELIVPVDFVLAAYSEEEAISIIKVAINNKYLIDNLDNVDTSGIDCEFLRDLKCNA